MPQSSATIPILIVGGKPDDYPPATALKRMALPVELLFLSPTDDVLLKCRTRRPVLVVLDLSGIATPLGLIADLQAATLPVPPALIVIGDGLTIDQREQALELGVVEAMERPPSQRELLLRLVTHARLHRRLSDIEAQVMERDRRLDDALTLLKAAERKLSEQAQLNGGPANSMDVIGSAAHELRTPLHAIIGFSELIRDEVHGDHTDHRYKEYAVDVLQAAQHLLTIVEDTLSLARAESGTEQLEIRRIDIGRAVHESTRLLRQLAANGGVELRVQTPDIPLHIRTDPEKIRQILLNLVSNAIKFTPKGGRVMVEVAGTDDDGAIILIVRDTGIGIAPQDLPTAMKPFGQIKRGSQPHPKGTGLGLPLTRRFVEMLGGVLEINSAAGKGTAISIKLPAEAPSDGTPPVQ